jgi:hypothetical protein
VYTPTTRWQDGVCHIAAYSTHANLGFNDGAALDDGLGVAGLSRREAASCNEVAGRERL